MQLDKKYVALAKKISLLEQQLKDANAEISRQREIISELESEIERSIIHSENENILDTIKDRRTGRITDDAKQQIVEAYRNGATMSTVAKQFNIAPITARLIVTEWNKHNQSNMIEIRKTNKIPHELELKIAEEIRKGCSASQAGKKFGVNRSTAFNIARRYHIDTSKHKKSRTPHDIELQIISYINQGNTWKATANKFNIPRGTMSTIVKRHGNTNAE